MPVLSVVIPAYNASRYLAETLESILSQDLQDIEIIVVDDKSTDNTKEITSLINSDKIRYIALQKNHGGPSKPRNVGCAAARGKYIALFDADDIMMPGILSKAVSFLDEHPHLGFVFSDCVKFQDDGTVHEKTRINNYPLFAKLQKKKATNDTFVIKSNEAFPCLFYENYLIPSGVVMPKAVWEDTGGFDQNLTNGDDRDMWFRISREYPIGFANTVGFKYRVGQSSISTRGGVLVYNRIKVLRKQYDGSLSWPLRQQIHKLVGENFYSLGYVQQQQLAFKEAKRSYWLSLKENFNWQAVKGLLIVSFPMNLLYQLLKSKSS